MLHDGVSISCCGAASTFASTLEPDCRLAAARVQKLPFQQVKYSLNQRQSVESCAQSGEAYFENGTGVAQFNGRRDSNVLAAVPQEVKRKWLDWRFESKRLSTQLKSYGVAGLLAYGLLNTLYYSATFLTVWHYFAKVPKGLGWSEACKQFATVMSVTWAASQVTKIPRAALALFLAPVADGSLIFLQARLRLRTRRNAFLLVVALCLIIAAVIFGVTVAMWA